MVIHVHARMNSTTHSTPKMCTQKSTHFCVDGSESRCEAASPDEYSSIAFCSLSRFSA